MLLSEVVLLPTKLFAVYLFLYFLIPKYLLRQQYLVFAVSALVVIAISGTVQRLIAYRYLFPWKSFDPSLSPFNVYEIMHQVISINTVMIIPIGVNLLSIWTRKKLEAKELERQYMETELKFLRNQLQPHFLFNTLNNLYSLILKKSETAEEVVLILSELMRYSLYETRAAKVDLEKEIYHIKNYIQLEKLRYGDRLDVGLNVYGDLSGLKVAPLILLHFVENSFKHSVTSLEQSWIAIELSVLDKTCLLKVENSKANTLENDNSTRLISGIGVENVKKQLDLTYGDRYVLKVEDTEESYLIILNLDLNE